jgi:AcrR family transcriptional regulator
LPRGIKSLHKKAPRKPRADAARNRERVLEAAKTVFSAGGAEASLEAVARTAGVGIGTLYRHFPTREALFEAVYRREVQQLADLAERLKEEAEPVEALRQWMRSNLGFRLGRCAPAANADAPTCTPRKRHRRAMALPSGVAL